MAKAIHQNKRRVKKKSKNELEKDLLKLMNNSVIGKIMENVRKRKDIVTTEKRRNYLVSEQIYHSAKFFTGNLLAIGVGKTKILSLLSINQST